MSLRELGLLKKEIKEKLGLTSQTTYQRFLRTNSYVAKNLQAGKKKRAKTNFTKSGKGPRSNIGTNTSIAKLFQRQKRFLDILFEKS